MADESGGLVSVKETLHANEHLLQLCRIKVPSRFLLCDIEFIGHYVASGPRTLSLGLPR